MWPLMEALTSVCFSGIGICLSSNVAISAPDPRASSAFVNAGSLARAITQISSLARPDAASIRGLSKSRNPDLFGDKGVMVEFFVTIQEASSRTKMPDKAKPHVRDQIDRCRWRFISFSFL